MFKKYIKNLQSKKQKQQINNTIIDSFHSAQYLQHSARRLEHLASLRLPVAGLRVLEVGSGIGDHSHYYIDRGCQITITEARKANLEHLKKRYPGYDVRLIDMENPPKTLDGSPFDIIHCYGLLYHLGNPEQAIKQMSLYNKKMLLIETCVSFGAEEEVNLLKEEKNNITQSYSGTGCRPTRPWVFKTLKENYEFVYIPKTQPNHTEFSLDWKSPEKHQARFARAIFIASHECIENELLAPHLLDIQYRHP